MHPLSLVLAATLLVSGCCQHREERDPHAKRHQTSGGGGGFQFTGSGSGGSGEGMLLVFGVVIVVVLVVALVDQCGC
jgi:hypothetical protein